MSGKPLPDTPRRVCPVCGDQSVYALWIDKSPPSGCPLKAVAVTECEFQMEKARQRALFRKLAPESFDENGNIKPGQIGHVLVKVREVEPDIDLLMGGGIPEDICTDEPE